MHGSYRRLLVFWLVAVCALATGPLDAQRNRVRERFGSKVLPFFSQHLDSRPAARAR